MFPLGTKSDADAQLAAPLPDRPCQHAVGADDGEDEGGASEERDDGEQESTLSRWPRGDVVQRLDLRERELRIAGPQQLPRIGPDEARADRWLVLMTRLTVGNGDL